MRAAWLLLLVALPAWGQMYKCVDKNGVTHYTELPQPGCKGREVDIRPLPSLSGGEVRRPAEDFAQQEADFKRRQNERASAEAQERAELEKRCRSLRQELATLSSGRRLGRMTPEGERLYMPDEAREQRLDQVRQSLRTCP